MELRELARGLWRWTARHPDWEPLDGYTQDDLREGLRPLLGLPVEMVLVSHGEPVLGDGHAALERAPA